MLLPVGVEVWHDHCVAGDWLTVSKRDRKNGVG